MSDLKLIGIVNASEFRRHVLEQRDKVTSNTLEEDEDKSLQVLKEICDSVQRLEQRMSQTDVFEESY